MGLKQRSRNTNSNSVSESVEGDEEMQLIKNILVIVVAAVLVVCPIIAWRAELANDGMRHLAKPISINVMKELSSVLMPPIEM